MLETTRGESTAAARNNPRAARSGNMLYLQGTVAAGWRRRERLGKDRGRLRRLDRPRKTMAYPTGVSVCVCGNVVADILVRPVEELRWAATTLVDTVSHQLGGNAGSTSYTVAKLGIPTFVVT